MEGCGSDMHDRAKVRVRGWFHRHAEWGLRKIRAFAKTTNEAALEAFLPWLSPSGIRIFGARTTGPSRCNVRGSRRSPQARNRAMIPPRSTAGSGRYRWGVIVVRATTLHYSPVDGPETMGRINQDASEYLKQVAAAVLRVMRTHAQLRFDDLLQKVDATVSTSAPSLRRACRWLREAHDAPLGYDNRLRMWVLERRDFSLPLLDPTADDIVAVAFAGALLSPIGDAELDRRVRSLLMEMDERITAGGRDRKLRSHAVMATSSATMPVNPRVVGTLATAVGRHVVRITYSSPWRDEPTVKTHVVEPWQLRVHDGNLYVRGWLRQKAVPSTFRVSQIQSIVVTGERPETPRPPAHDIWGDDGPGMGVDVDRPGRATVRIRGAMARYVGSTAWHEEQHDRWVEKDQLLERTFFYESCRATARWLLGLGDALEQVEPDTLRRELAGHAAALVRITK